MNEPILITATEADQVITLTLHGENLIIGAEQQLLTVNTRRLPALLSAFRQLDQMLSDSSHHDSYGAGYERGANTATHAHTLVIEQLKFHLAWSLFELEKSELSHSVRDHIQFLRDSYRLDLVGGGVRDFSPQSTHVQGAP